MLSFAKIGGLFHSIRSDIPFYSDKISGDINNLTDHELDALFHQLPVLTKEKIKKNYPEFVSKRIRSELVERAAYERHIGREEHLRKDDGHYFFEYTSGSSGIPFVVVKSMDERIALGRVLWAARKRFARIKTHEAFNCNDSSVHFIEAEDLIRHGYKMWMVNVNRLEKLKNYFFVHNTKPSGLTLIENAGSFITKEEQCSYEEFFGCAVTNYYGCAETWGIAYSCNNKELHLMDDTAYVELLDQNGQVITESGCVGRVTITSYLQKTMPFIRYQTGDTACYSHEKCPCGSAGRVIRLVPNRNMIVGTNLYGSSHFRNITVKLISDYKITRFKSISVVQTDLNTFDVNVKGYSGDLDAFESAYTEAARAVLERDDFSFCFRYDEKGDEKNIFSLSPYLQSREGF